MQAHFGGFLWIFKQLCTQRRARQQLFNSMEKSCKKRRTLEQKHEWCKFPIVQYLEKYFENILRHEFCTVLKYHSKCLIIQMIWQMWTTLLFLKGFVEEEANVKAENKNVFHVFGNAGRFILKTSEEDWEVCCTRFRWHFTMQCKPCKINEGITRAKMKNNKSYARKKKFYQVFSDKYFSTFKNKP